MLHAIEPTVSCPTCGRPVEWSSRQRWRPFCSERCRLIDLGSWMGGTHRIPGDESEPEFPDSLEDFVGP